MASCAKIFSSTSADAADAQIYGFHSHHHMTDECLNELLQKKKNVMNEYIATQCLVLVCLFVSVFALKFRRKSSR